MKPGLSALADARPGATVTQLRQEKLPVTGCQWVAGLRKVTRSRVTASDAGPDHGEHGGEASDSEAWLPRQLMRAGAARRVAAAQAARPGARRVIRPGGRRASSTLKVSKAYRRL